MAKKVELVLCSQCDKDVSYNANTCPHCNDNRRFDANGGRLSVVSLVAGGFFVLNASISSEPLIGGSAPTTGMVGVILAIFAFINGILFKKRRIKEREQRLALTADNKN